MREICMIRYAGGGGMNTPRSTVEAPEHTSKCKEAPAPTRSKKKKKVKSNEFSSNFNIFGLGQE